MSATGSHSILTPRSSPVPAGQRSRRAAHDQGSTTCDQVIAANLDVVFIAASLGEGLTHAYSSATSPWRSRAAHVPCSAHEGRSRADPSVVKRARRIDDVIPIHATDLSGLGLDAVREHLAPNLTGAPVGPSASASRRWSTPSRDRTTFRHRRGAPGRPGRHTTTRRQLVILPGGGLIVDNPGMREVHLWLAQDGLTDAFEDITALAAECRFSDCSHESEPCAVQAALADAADSSAGSATAPAR